MKTRNGAIVWSLQGVYLTGWAAGGMVVWIPQLLGACLSYALSLARCTLSGTSTRRAHRRLHGATHPYRRFVGAMESVRTSTEESRAPAPRHVGPWRLLGQLAWATLVWYVILWPAGVIHLSPAELASTLASVLGPFGR